MSEPSGDDLHYPNRPGEKREGTSEDAGKKIRGNIAETREIILNAMLRLGPMTADECAAHIAKSILFVRPRFSELVKLEKIKKTGDRRTNDSGMRANVYAVAEDPAP